MNEPQNKAQEAFDDIELLRDQIQNAVEQGR